MACLRIETFRCADMASSSSIERLRIDFLPVVILGDLEEQGISVMFIRSWFIEKSLRF